MKDESTLYWLWLSERCGTASRDFGTLMRQYDHPFDVYCLDEEEIEHLTGIGERLKERLCDKNLDFAYQTRHTCEKMGADIVPYGSPLYPERLKKLEDPPVLLYVLGQLPQMNDRLCIGMVGTRKMSEYGRESAYKISYELAAAYGVIVSGMARGVDGVAACGALAAKGSTVAVLGCGLSIVYPREHKCLMQAIAEHGAVVTEYPPTERPYGANFPKRNRIISGLCQGVLVVEGAHGSGALITAEKALEQGRDVFALPGNINESGSDGPNDLIRNGALPVLSSEDILRHYDFLYHDKIDYRSHNRAQNHPYPEESALRDYGVALSDTRKRVPTAPKPSPVATKSPKEEAAEAAVVPPSEAPEVRDLPSVSSEVWKILDPTCRRVWEAMPQGMAVSTDALRIEGLSTPELMTALTLLEVSELCTSLPGGLYIRKVPKPIEN